MPARLGRYLFETNAFGENAVAERMTRPFGDAFSEIPFANVPNLAEGVNMTPSGSNDTYGTFVSVTTGLDRDRLITKVLLNLSGTGTPPSGRQCFTVRLANESDSSFSDLRLLECCRGTTATLFPVVVAPLLLPFPIWLPAGTPVRGALAQNGATPTAIDARVSFEATLPSLFPKRTLVIDPTRLNATAGYRPVPDTAPITVASATNAYSSGQIISTGEDRDLYIVGVICGKSTTTATSDSYLHGRILLGTSGSEIPVADLPLSGCSITCSATLAYHAHQPTFLNYPVFVPQGTSMRFQLAANQAINHSVTFLVVPASEVIPLEQIT